MSLYCVDNNCIPIGSPSDVLPHGIVIAGIPSRFAKIQLEGHSNSLNFSVSNGLVFDLKKVCAKPLGT